MTASTEQHSEDVEAVEWRDGRLRLLDQRGLPDREIRLELETAPAVADAIRSMVVRGAPAIGIAAAYGTALAARAAWRRAGAQWRDAIATDLDALRQARPTAVNLAWAIARLERLFPTLQGDPFPPLLDAARTLQAQDVAANRAMGAAGAACIEPGATVLTHCNAGALATGGYGTALGVIRSAWRAGRIRRVYAGETRPWLQGARLTAWELARAGIPVELIVDGAAAHLMRARGVDWVIVGADRIAANGDVANKIGTYALALLARAHGARVMVVAPCSTIDPATPDGATIPIEVRPADEVLAVAGRRVAAAGAGAWNPSFDVTPAGLVDCLVTERGILRSPGAADIARLLAGAPS